MSSGFTSGVTRHGSHERTRPLGFECGAEQGRSCPRTPRRTSSLPVRCRGDPRSRSPRNHPDTFPEHSPAGRSAREESPVSPGRGWYWVLQSEQKDKTMEEALPHACLPGGIYFICPPSLRPQVLSLSDREQGASRRPQGRSRLAPGVRGVN